jgi:hypothetical protein
MGRAMSDEQLKTWVEETLRQNRAAIARGAGRTQYLEEQAERSKIIVERAVKRLREDLARR